MKRRTFLAAGLASAASPALGTRPPAATIRLSNRQWSVQIEPRSLAIEVLPVGASAVTMSRGVAERVVSDLETAGQTASWRWDGVFDMACTLDGPDLAVRVTASAPGELTLLDQPGAAMGKGMMLPLSEGYYVDQE